MVAGVAELVGDHDQGLPLAARRRRGCRRAPPVWCCRSRRRRRSASSYAATRRPPARRRPAPSPSAASARTWVRSSPFGSEVKWLNSGSTTHRVDPRPEHGQHRPRQRRPTAATAEASAAPRPARPAQCTPANTQRDQQRDALVAQPAAAATGWSGRTPARCCGPPGRTGAWPGRRRAGPPACRAAPRTHHGPRHQPHQPRTRAGSAPAPGRPPARPPGDGPAEVALHRGVGLGRAAAAPRENTSLARTSTRWPPGTHDHGTSNAHRTDEHERRHPHQPQAQPPAGPGAR